MALLYKEDWDETKDRFKAWWAHEYFGRCALAVTAPLANPPPAKEPVRPPTPLARWTDLDYISAKSDWENARTFFGGEAFPAWGYGYPGYAWIPTWLGGAITLDWNTGWNGSANENSWEITEPGIYYQAKYCTVLGYFCGPAG